MKFVYLLLVCIVFCGELFSQSLTYTDYRDYVMDEYNFKKYHDSKKNIFIKNNVVHIFIDEMGNLIETGIPTTAIEKYSYKLHLITNSGTLDTTRFVYSYRGEYKPSFNVQNGSLDNQEPEVRKDEVDETKNPSIIEFQFATIGPFTDDFTINVKRIASEESVILESKINVAKNFHVSISTGLFMTSLVNPSNIRTSTTEEGRTTLIADDHSIRGLVSLNAVFYPQGRSFLFPPSGTNLFDPERFGIIVGTQLDRAQFENFVGGMQWDFARGGSISIGAHFGRRNAVAGYDNFDFGKEIYTGNIDNDLVKEWAVGLILGINLDVRIFGQLFAAVQ